MHKHMDMLFKKNTISINLFISDNILHIHSRYQDHMIDHGVINSSKEYYVIISIITYHSIISFSNSIIAYHSIIYYHSLIFNCIRLSIDHNIVLFCFFFLYKSATLEVQHSPIVSVQWYATNLIE